MNLACCTETTNILKDVRSSNIVDDHIISVPAGLLDINGNETEKDAARDAADNTVLFDGFIVATNSDSNISVAAILQNTDGMEVDLFAGSDASDSDLKNIPSEQPTQQSSKKLNNKETNFNQGK